MVHLSHSCQQSRFLLILLLCAGIVFIWFVYKGHQVQPHHPLQHHLYIWNRKWNAAVSDSIRIAQEKAKRFVILAGQIDKVEGKPVVTRIPVNFNAFRRDGVELGLALRVSSLPGSATQVQAFHQAVRTIAEELIQDTSHEHLSLSEIQIDYDCPESGLEDYRRWIEELRSAIAPVPLTITALPAWLKHKEFKDLAETTDGFVLQVHSLKTPNTMQEELTLCEPEEVSRWIQQAGRIGIPFRVALPTYGYTIAFNPQGRFAGLWAEGPQPDWPSGYTVREVHTSPAQIVRIVNHLKAEPLQNLTGMIWFRMPIAGDRMNWSWATLAAVMEGRTPKPRLEAKGIQTEPGLVDIVLTNVGDADSLSLVEISVNWDYHHLLAVDSLGGYTWSQPQSNQVLFRKEKEKLRTGEERSIGWLRFDGRTEVYIDAYVAE